MYPIERAMKVFKGYVRNRSRLEASMAKGYILDETIGFVTEYLQDFHHVRHRIWDADEEEGVYGEVVEGVATKLIFGPCSMKCGTSICYHKCGMFNIVGSVHNP
jgi:hypothetical protein